MTRLTRTDRIDAPLPVVWEVLVALDRAQRWDPTVSASAWKTRKRGVGGARRLTVSGFTFEQAVTVWSQHRALELRTGARGPFRWLVETFRLDHQHGRTTVRTCVEADYRLPVQWLVEPVLKRTVAASMAGLRAYVERDEAPSIVVELPALFPQA